MTKDECFDAIVEHGLSIRQVPRDVVSLYELRHFKDGDTIIEQELSTSLYDSCKKTVAEYPKSADNYRFDDREQRVFRRFVRKVKIPNHAGYWMCKQVKGTSSSVRWVAGEDNIAPTLEESVSLFLSKTK